MELEIFLMPSEVLDESEVETLLKKLSLGQKSSNSGPWVSQQPAFVMKLCRDIARPWNAGGPSYFHTTRWN